MKRFFDPELVLRTYRNPLAWLVLTVDLLPILAIVIYGWGAVPLVALYWLENLVIGVMTILRMIGTGFTSLLNLAGLVLIIPFFIFHYGMFCYGHGLFIRSMSGKGMSSGGEDPLGLVQWALGSGQGMAWFVGAILAVNLMLYVSDYILKGEFRDADLGSEMFAPYGRIVTLHVAIILGAFLAIGLGQPLLGVLLLIILRVVFGVIVSMLRQFKREAGGDRTADALAQGV
ncbi:DUF6498-containing protein [Hyphomonas pacifica]|uniref:DUF6498-containing protein n=1 Tax=Hyphomonas pacifica TaxID=1280941 RepID=UPI000DC0037D|nr:DUF6498-containing protein [Hyphomonas pacifica]RAN32128.1 hypothetical protein HY11_06000 [Hyphomonas pacifica]